MTEPQPEVLDGNEIHSLLVHFEDTPRIQARRPIVDARLRQVSSGMPQGGGINVPLIRQQAYTDYLVARIGVSAEGLTPGESATFWREDCELFFLDELMRRLDQIEHLNNVAKLTAGGPPPQMQIPPEVLARMRQG
jgi:hypothetical protein